MRSLLEQFRAEAGRSNQGRSGRGRRYSRELRALAVRHLVAEQARGRGLAEISAELGISSVTLSRWSKTRVGFREVQVIETDEGSDFFTVVTPDGFRIEGLDVARLAEVVRALR